MRYVFCENKHKVVDFNNNVVIELTHQAGIAQLVEHQLPKLGVASSNLVSRSNFISVSL